MATVLQTYDLNGNKLSFANWIANLSPSETPFGSMTKKEKVDQTQYSWQTDYLSAPSTTAVAEGSEFAYTVPVAGSKGATVVHTNFTQILRKVVKVTDTTKKISLYGRGSEVPYQLEKAGKEIRRDLELMLLTNTVGNIGSNSKAGKFSGFEALCAAKASACPDTGAITHKEVTQVSANADRFNLANIFDITMELYKAGSKANKIMVHPKYMYIFSDLVGFNTKKPHVHRMFDGMDTKFNAHIGRIRDPLGQEFDIVPNRFMPEDKIFIFNPSDWTQMVLREPVKTELAKTGSADKFMIEMEVGLRHRNPYASGILELKAHTGLPFAVEEEKPVKVKAKKA